MKLSFDFYKTLREDVEVNVSIAPYFDSETEALVLSVKSKRPLFIVHELLELLKEYEDDEDYADEAAMLRYAVLTSHPELKFALFPEARAVVIFKNITVQIKEDAEDEIVE